MEAFQNPKGKTAPLRVTLTPDDDDDDDNDDNDRNEVDQQLMHQ